MSIFDHEKSEDTGVCIWCHENWPCEMGRARIDVAAAIRTVAVGPTWDASYDSGKESGLELAAELIDGTWKP